MEFTEVVRRRRMVRRYGPEPVDPAVVDRLLANAVHAPSAGFSQGWAFLVLDTPDDVARFWSAATPPERAAAPDAWLRGMSAAPVVVVPMSSEATYRRRYAEPDKRRAGGRVPDDTSGDTADAASNPWPVPYWHVDAGMASLLILQTAVDEGLGACFFGIPGARVPVLRAAFGVPDDVAPVGAITVGHRVAGDRAGGSAATHARRPLREVVHRGRWAAPDASR